MVLSSLDERKHLPHQLRILVTFFLANNVNVIFYRFFLSRFGASILPVF